jgi:hypothetical protein
MGLDETQAAYDAALRRVISDVTATTDLRPDIAVDFTEPETQYRFENRHWSSLPEAENEEVAAAALADRVQDDVLDELWGSAWPDCPGHPHPANPVLLNEKAVWSCPADARPICAIGELHAARGRRSRRNGRR